MRFDPDAPVVEPSPKQQKTSLYSPVYAGDLPEALVPLLRPDM